MNARFRTLLIITLAVLGIACAAQARVYISDPKLPDTVRVDSVRALRGSQVAVPIYFANDEPLSGIEITICRRGSAITLDSFSFAGSSISYIQLKGASFHDSVMSAYAVPSSEFFIYPGRGLFGKLYVTVSDSAALGPVMLDTVTVTVDLVEHATWFSDVDLQTFVPQFRAGQVNIQDSCCLGRRGNIDGSADDVVDVSDLTITISYLFITPDYQIACPEEADVSPDEGDGIVDVSDLTRLITFLFIDASTELPGCQ